MQDKHGSHKETDITAVLVIAFVLIVGVLIAKTAGDFAAKPTSTSTKAFGAKCEDGKLVWWSKSVTCPVAKVDNECPSTNTVNDKTGKSPGGTPCHSTTSMDTYFLQEYQTVINIRPASVKRGNDVCTSGTGESKSVCLISPWDHINGKVKDTSPYKNYTKFTSWGKPFGITCPILLKDGVVNCTGFGDCDITVRGGECYIPGK
jgi:hypothetical protein